MKNFIIGYGETLTSKVEVKSGSGDKSHPYTFTEARNRFVSDLEHVISEIEEKPDGQCVNGEVVVKFTQHPSYLAKTYYPNSFFKRYGVKDVGSKSLKLKPRKWAIKKHPEEGLTTCIYVSGSKEQFEAMLNNIHYDVLPENVRTIIRTFEEITTIDTNEKIKNIDEEAKELRLEVVLHGTANQDSVIPYFNQYINSLGGTADWNKVKTVGELTFLPVTVPKHTEYALAQFSHLRVLRSIPKLRFNRPDIIRSTINEAFSLPVYETINNDFKVCIFDGGLGENTLISSWANEIIPEDVTNAHPSLLAHGGEVCSTYLFGPYNSETKSFRKPYTNVDIVRVLSPDDNDPDLFDVLTRIENVLKQKKYKYVNLSLGPRLPIEDDDVHVWTSVIDSLLQDGHCLATVAIGNDGDLEGEYRRIQPPSDMVNCFAVGATDSQ